MNSEAGHVHNLSSEQRRKLAQIWAAIYYCFAVDADNNNALLDLITDAELKAAVESQRSDLLRKLPARSDTSASIASNSSSKRSWNPFSRSSSSAREEDVLGPTNTQPTEQQLALDVSNYQPDHPTLLHEMHRAFGTEHPDVLVLRFLRARKWVVAAALEMFIKATKWRQKADVNGFMRDSERLVGDKVLKSGKAYVYGTDKQGRPISVSHVALHDPKAQPLLETMRFCVYQIEVSRLLLKPPQEMATILFDFRNFGLRNMDNDFVKFLIGALEAYYPESLGLCLMLEAPAVFRGLWAVIKGWLDPVVAAKVHFVRIGDLPQHIEKSYILEQMQGESEWVYKFGPGNFGPRASGISEGEQKANEAFREACAEFDTMNLDYIKSILSSSSSPVDDNDNDNSKSAKREEAVEKIKARVEEARRYWVSETYYHRAGFLDKSQCWRGD